MSASRRVVHVSFALVLAACASTKVTHQTPMGSPGLARPSKVWVYDFIADPADIPADSSIRSGLTAPATPLSAKDIATGQQLGAMIANYLIDDISRLGFVARRPEPRSPEVGDVVLRGADDPSDPAFPQV